MTEIPESFHEMLTEQPTYATLTTMLPDGLPHNTVVWIDYDADADRVLINTERGRQKERNVRDDPRAGVLAPEPDSWFRWLSVSGEVDEVTTEGAREHIDTLARRYTGASTYRRPIETERVILKLAPEHVMTFDPDR